VAQLDELRRVSRHPRIKAILPAHRVGTMINNMRRTIVLDALPPLPDGIEVSDPNDVFLLAMALAGCSKSLKHWRNPCLQGQK